MKYNFSSRSLLRLDRQIQPLGGGWFDYAHHEFAIRREPFRLLIFGNYSDAPVWRLEVAATVAKPAFAG